MLGTERSDDILDGEVLDAEGAGCVELVPVSQQINWSRKASMARPDPSFIAQLIATADHAPQTCKLRRGSVEDAQMAYGSHPLERRSVARRTRQVI